MRFGILGLDNWYHAYPLCEALARDDELTLQYIVDRDAARADALAEKYNTKSYGADFKKAISSESVDAVVVCAHTTLHEELVTSAAKQDIAILLDKPIAHSTESANRLLQVVREHDVKAMMMFPNRLNPELVWVKQLLAEHRGNNRACISWIGRWPLPRADAGVATPGWYAEPEFAGYGAFLDHAVHQFDALRWLLGLEVATISAHIGNLYHEKLNIDDYGIATAVMADGSTATIESGWVIDSCSAYTDKLIIDIPGYHISRERGCVSTNSCFSEARGKAEFNMELGPSVEVTSGHKVYIREFDRVMERFVAYVNEDQAPIATLQDGYKSLEICEAAYKSSIAGKRIELNA